MSVIKTKANPLNALGRLEPCVNMLPCLQELLTSPSQVKPKESPQIHPSLKIPACFSTVILRMDTLTGFPCSRKLTEATALSHNPLDPKSKAQSSQSSTCCLQSISASYPSYTLQGVWKCPAERTCFNHTLENNTHTHH